MNDRISNRTAGQPALEGEVDDILRLAWGEYRSWAATSRALKERVTRAGLIVLSLTLIGTALGSLAPLVPSDNRLSEVMPWVAAAALAAATYLASQLLNESERQSWVRARAAAEALKGEACRYATAAPPYEGPDAADLLARKVSDVQRIAPGVLVKQIGAEERERELPRSPWSVDDYLQKRLREQIDSFYRPAIARHTAAVGRARVLTIALGIAAVVLSVAGANFGAWPAATLGVVTTAAAALGAWFQGGHHQELALNYQAAAARLELLAARHRTSATTGTQLVVEAEAVFQAEHAAWLAEWQTAERSTQAPPTSGGATG